MAVGWSTFFLPFLFVFEPSLLMSGPLWLTLWNLARNLLGIFVGTAAVVGYAFTPLPALQRGLFGTAAIAILIPANAFSGARLLDWLGLGGSVLLLAVNFALSRARAKAS